jgi:hypothetical protein
VCEQRYGIRVERFGFDVVEAGAAVAAAAAASYASIGC